MDMFMQSLTLTAKELNMIYCYYIANRLASLHKMHTNGKDCDDKPVKIGRFDNEEDAKKACLKHYEKACRMAVNAGRDKPEIRFV